MSKSEERRMAVMDEDKLMDLQRRRPLLRVSLADLDWAMDQVVTLRGELATAENALGAIVAHSRIVSPTVRTTWEVIAQRALDKIRKVVGE